MTSLADPVHVVIMGDVHGNYRWVANYAIPEAARLLDAAGESRKIIIQLGDFGFRLGPDLIWLRLVHEALRAHEAELWWIDGNHEDWPGIRRLIPEHQFDDDGYPPQTVPIPGVPRIRYLPRGTRWTWAGRTWLAVGGAVSVDRLSREEGLSWWQDEEITDAQADAIIADGPADVLVAHDVPRAWMPGGLPAPHNSWLPMLPQAAEHSRRLERVARATGVRRVFHGHYHWPQDIWREGVHVTGLLEDGYTGNLTLVNVLEVTDGSGSGLPSH